MRITVSAPRAGAMPLHRAPLVLVVSSRDFERTGICRLLRAQGYRPMPASHGVDANWVVERRGAEIALVITDLLAPTPDGYHLGIPFARLRPYTPVLFVGEGARKDLVERGLLHPRAEYLQKPYAPSALRRRVHEIIARWPALPAA